MKNDKNVPAVECAAQITRDRGISYEFMLQSMAERMRALAEQLAKGGELDLTKEDKELLRIAAVPALRDSFQELVAAFMLGESPRNPLTFIADLCNDLTGPSSWRCMDCGKTITDRRFPVRCQACSK